MRLLIFKSIPYAASPLHHSILKIQRKPNPVVRYHWFQNLSISCSASTAPHSIQAANRNEIPTLPYRPSVVMTPQNWLAMLPSWVSQAPRPKVELKKLVVSCPTALIAEPTLVAILATLLKTVPMTWVIHVVKPRKALVMAVPMAPSPTKPPNALSPTTMADHTKLKKVKILARMNTPPLISQRITGP